MTTQQTDMEFFDYWILICGLLGLQYETSEKGIDIYQNDDLLLTIYKSGFITLPLEDRTKIKEILTKQMRGNL